MNTLAPIALGSLPAPQVVESLDFESILAERKAQLLALFPAEQQLQLAERLQLESEPLVKLLEENSYRELLWRQRVNEAAGAVMLSYAGGNDLVQLAANFNVSRLLISPAQPDAATPLAAVWESDDALRERTQMAMEGLSTAGPRNAYIFHARSSDGRVADATCASPAPAEVVVTVQSALGDGSADSQLLAVVAAYLGDVDRRPVADRLTVQGAEVLNYQLSAQLYLKTVGPESEPIRATAEARLQAFLNQRQRLGLTVSESGLHAALHIEGVSKVELIDWLDIIASDAQVPYCTGYSLVVMD